MMKASDVFVRCLENEGVHYVFGVPGEETEDILFSLENSRVRFIPTRHEQGAAFMADMWGRVTGTAGVCLSTLGPGATNLVTGVADANLDKSPVVAISAQSGLQRVHKESHQYLSLVDLFRPVTKWNSTVISPQVIPEVVRKAFKIAESEKPGASHLEISEDIAAANVDDQYAEPLARRHVCRPDPDRSALSEAVTLLKKAKYPLVLAGNGAVRHQSSEALQELVQTHDIPIVHTFMGQGAFPDSRPQSLLTIGFGFRDIVMEAMERADVVITIGYDIAEYAPDAWNPHKDKCIIHIDFTPAEVYAHYQPCVEIVADIPRTLREFNRQLDGAAMPFDRAWYRSVRQDILEDIAGYALKENDRFTIPGVLHILQSVMGGDDLLISDVGSHKLWIARNFSACCPNGVIISNGLASMGIALPGAVAASLACPQRRIVAAMGDGGFLMNCQELETAKRLGVAFTVVIFNDNDYGLISWKQETSRGHSTGTKLTNPNFKDFAESFGIKGYCPSGPSELRRQLAGSLQNRELSVFEVPVDTGVNQELIRKLKRGKNGIHQPSHR